jgi:hypothetical protein
VFGSRRAGEKLIAAMAADDEQNRMLAGMSLVKAGQRSFDFIAEKVDGGEATPAVVRLLSDIDGARARTVLDKLVAGDSVALADAAQQCIDNLDSEKKP